MADQQSVNPQRNTRRERLDTLREVMQALESSKWDLSIDDLITLAEYVRTGQYCRSKSSEHLTVQREGGK
jgi:hypothetical protein